MWGAECLAAEAVEGSSLSLEGVDHIHGGHGLSSSVLGVGDSVSDDVLKENLEHTSGLLVDEAGDSLDTASSGKSSNSGLGDTLDVVTKHLSVSLGASFTETFTAFTSARHDCFGLKV